MTTTTPAPTADSPHLTPTTVMMLLADARLPVGAHVSSGALEAALRNGLSSQLVGEYLAARMRTVNRVEAGTAVVARHLAGCGRPLEMLRAEWAARTPSRAQREISVVLGDGLRRLTATLRPAAVLTGTRWPRPIVLGVLAESTGLAAEDLVRLIAYDDAQTVVSAMLKLEPGDPLKSASTVMKACAAMEPFVDELAALDRPDRIPSAGAPQTEDWSEIQSTMPRRLFRA